MNMMSTTKGNALPDLMCDRRPDWLEDRIDRLAPIADDFPGYTHLGIKSVYDFRVLLQGRTDSDKLARDLSDEHQRALKILDIGAGFGQVGDRLQRIGHDVHAISGHDYLTAHGVSEGRRMSGGSYFVGDANRMLSMDGLYDEYDLILSKWCFNHLVDPVGTLEQVVNRLALGGVIAVSQFLTVDNDCLVRTDQPWSENDYIEYPHFVEGCLNDVGFDTRPPTGMCAETMDGLIVVAKKVEDVGPIRFPLRYEQHPEVIRPDIGYAPWSYAWTDERSAEQLDVTADLFDLI
ncbi:MAG TPA: hypothetical protein PKB09_04195 [Candidatus Saccharibacteria bacterium]|mgnify:CR=1 FL=1|nr:hypothetical protein [Candidatus Saccharibacteria bacterium]